MKRDILHNKTAAFLLSFGLLLSQIPAYAAVGDGNVPSDDAANATTQIADAVAPMPSSAPSMTIKATQEDRPVLSGTISSVDNLSRDILHQEVTLERYNLLFRTNAAKQGRWKGWRFFIGQEGSLLATAAGGTVYVADSFDHIHASAKEHPHHATAGQSKNIRANGGLIPGIAGAGAGIAADAIELGVNMGHSAAAKRNGYGFTAAREKAAQLLASIDSKLAMREKLIKEEPAADKETAEMQELEGKVLADYRDLSVAEFERYWVGARKTLAQQNSFYILDAVMNKTPSIISSSFGIADILGFEHLKVARPGFDIVTGTFAMIQGAFIVANPLLSRAYGKMVEKGAKKELVAHGLPTVWEKGDKLETDWGHLTGFCSNHQMRDRPELAALVQRMDAYDANHRFYVDELQRNARALRRGNRTAVQNIEMAGIVGGSKIAQATLILRCGHYERNNVQRYTLFSTGALVYLPSVYLASLDNVRIQVGNERRRAKLKADNALPGQIIKARMMDLDKVEKKI